MEEEQIAVIGMVWYSLEHYTEIKAMMKDRHLLPATYSEWRLYAEQNERQIRRQGKRTIRANLVPNVFREFCLAHSLDFDARGRMEFANWAAIQAYRNGEVG